MKKRAVPKGNKNIYIIFGLLALIFGILIYLSMQNKTREGMKSADKKTKKTKKTKKSATDSESDNTESATETMETAFEKPASATKKPAETGTEAAITDMLNDALKKIKK